MIRNKKILITGGAGFIGSHLAEKLYKENEIVIFDNLHRNSLKYIPELKRLKNIKLIKGDVIRSDDLVVAMKGCNIVLHLASIAGVSSHYENPYRTLETNLIGTHNILTVSKFCKIEKLVYFSTSEVYGDCAYDADEECGFNAGSINDFRWSYSISKLASESLVLRYAELNDFKAYVVRPFNIYGPRQLGEGAIGNFIRAIISNKPMRIYNKGISIRAWCYVSDCVNMLIRLLDSNLNSQVFNVGNPNATQSTYGLARLINQALDLDIQIIFIDNPNSDIKVRIPNIDKATKFLDWYPIVELSEGIKKTYEWFKENYSD